LFKLGATIMKQLFPRIPVSRHPARLIALVLTTALLAAAISGPIAGATGPSFAAHQDFATGTNPASVAVGDLNGDGKLDLVIANAGANIVSVLLNTTAPGAVTPSFAAKQDFATGASPFSVAVGDLNGDGKLRTSACSVIGFSSRQTTGWSGLYGCSYVFSTSSILAM
jgi:hypothetical protein